MRDNARLCPIASLVLAAGILFAFGFTWGDAPIVAAMLACPLAMLWTLVFGRIPGEAGAEAAPETEGKTIDWMAPFYDRLCALFGLGRAFRRRILDVAALQPGERVLDAGCGTGVWTRLAAGNLVADRIGMAEALPLDDLEVQQIAARLLKSANGKALWRHESGFLFLVTSANTKVRQKPVVEGPSP